VIDGEIVVPAADGTTDFSVLQNELKGPSTKIVMVAFDLLYLNGRDLRELPLLQRKAELKKIIAGTDIQFSESFEIDGQAMFAHACKLGLEGVVSKVRDSTYPAGRSNDWVMKTCAQRETLTIAGFALDGTKWDGLYVGRRKGDELVYAGKVDHGFDKASAADLRKRLEPLVRKTRPSPGGSRTRASGSSPSSWPRSSTAQSRRRERSGTRSSKDCARICDDDFLATYFKHCRLMFWPPGRVLILALFGVNIVLHMLWSPLFFALKRPDWALIEVPFLWLSTAALMFGVGR